MTPHFRDEGSERPLVLLHGLGASSRGFDPLFARRGKRRLISIDLPRSGRSAQWSASNPKALAESLLAFLDARHVHRFEIFGHSFGGLVALQLAAMHPRRIERLNVASAPALGMPAQFKVLLGNPAMDMSFNWFGKFPVWRPALRAYMGVIWGSKRKLTSEILEMFEEAIGAQGFSEGMLESLRAVVAFQLAAPELRAAPFEKRLLWGEKDRLVSVVDGERLAKATGGELTVLNDVGHCVPEEAPEELAGFLDL